ncbi:PEP-CTERM sorting domain-containing protein [Aeoliella mucimassa]|uniref:PEP-CTERM motif protein n=1 Tax=Aeoliella mucimassa TaxID=2527972 RepID=A0A518AM67_9BACT|nr:PEP-CTERM sorting domain-containing protein [Aeoliella mucimassa]QDU55823.1 PEP-CTERM motif protein [Aeoliella mucimassa]
MSRSSVSPSTNGSSPDRPANHMRKVYSVAAAATAGLVSAQADGAVRYSGVQDISIELGYSQDLSIDADEYADIRLKNSDYFGGPYQGASVLFSPGRLLTFNVDGRPLVYAKALDEGYGINASSIGDYFFGSMAYGVANPYAEFNNVDGAFLGLSFPIADDLHYGWVRVTIDNAAGSFVINDWAYNDEPSVGLLAGEMPGPLTADFNNDGRVDLADYTVWRDNLGADESTGVLNGNGTNDGLVDSADYDLWKANFGNSTFTGDPIVPSTAPLSTAAVPEPGTLGMLAAGSLGIAALRRRNARRG